MTNSEPSLLCPPRAVLVSLPPNPSFSACFGLTGPGSVHFLSVLHWPPVYRAAKSSRQKDRAKNHTKANPPTVCGGGPLPGSLVAPVQQGEHARQ